MFKLKIHEENEKDVALDARFPYLKNRIKAKSFGLFFSRSVVNLGVSLCKIIIKGR